MPITDHGAGCLLLNDQLHPTGFGFGIGTGLFPNDSQTGRLTATPAMQRTMDTGQTWTQMATTGARDPLHPGRDILQKTLGDQVVTVDV